MTRRLNVIKIPGGEAFGTITLVDGALQYSDPLDRQIVESLAASAGWTTPQQVMDGLSGWSNGYMGFVEA